MKPNPAPHRSAESTPTAGALANVRASWIGWAMVVVMIIVGSAVRIDTALDHPSFHRDRPDMMLKSDPALLYYFTHRILDHGGMPPDDFRADTQVEYPEGFDVAGMETPGQEFLVAWTYEMFGGTMPLQVWCVIVMGVFATLCVIGVYGLSCELTRDFRWGVTAALLFTVFLANYRTIGFILIREDFALPWYALHLWMLARAARVQSRTAMTLCGLSFLLAMSFWHAMGFVAAIEVACLLAWFLRSGENPLRIPHAWLAVAVVAAGSLVVPVLRCKIFVLSLPMQMALALLASAAFERLRIRAGRSVSRPIHALVVCGALGILLLASILAGKLANSGLGDYSHVFQLMLTKLRTLGELPDDPNSIPFEARLLWQGPFETGTMATFFSQIPIGAALLPVAFLLAIPGWWRGRGEPKFLLLAAFATACALVGWLVVRTMILVGLIAPVLVVVLLQRVLSGLASAEPCAANGARPISRATWTIWSAGLVLPHALFFAGALSHFSMPWYIPVQQQELAPLLQWVRNNVADGQPIGADLVNSTAILAGTGHPILLQPKYETRESRRRIEEFLHTYFHGTTEDLRKLLIERYRCHYLLVDPNVLWLGERYLAGIPDSVQTPRPGTAAAALQATEDASLRAVQNYELVYRSRIASSYRLFRLKD